MKIHILATAILILSFAVALHGQEEDGQVASKPSPYELISSYYKDDFKPFAKGTPYLGLAFALQDRSLENTQRLLDKVVDGNQFNYELELKGGYFIGDYVMVGLNFNYAFDKFEGSLVRESDTVRSETISRFFTAVPVLKAYFPVTANERLSFFTEIGVGFGGGNALTRETVRFDEVSKEYSSNFRFSVGFTPGITFFAIEDFAFEVGINVIGYTLNRTDTTINDTEQAVDLRHNVNLNINLLSLKLGLAYYF